MHESVAIVLQLIDEHPDSRLAPQSAQPTVPRIISGASLHVRSSTRIYST
jgi:hypothetical protein